MVQESSSSSLFVGDLFSIVGRSMVYSRGLFTLKDMAAINGYPLLAGHSSTFHGALLGMCSDRRCRLLRADRTVAIDEGASMFANARSNWTRVLSRRC